MNRKDNQEPEPSGEPGPGDKAVEELQSAGGADAQAPQHAQQQVEEHEATQSTKFGTFAGVFTPTLLTILGVIMFLRDGWVSATTAWAAHSSSSFSPSRSRAQPRLRCRPS